MVLGGFSSPGSSCFPEGLHVLVVDHDPQWLKNLEKMLKKCNYEVTTSSSMQEALRLLRERKDRFDIVISDVNTPDMDAFQFLENVGLKMDIPVIIMSADGERSRAMRVIEQGACDYLLKPIRLKELRNIWKHVFRKRMQQGGVIEGDESQTMRNETDQSEKICGNKQKEVENKSRHRECDGSSSVKNPRVIWTADLHEKFVKAVNQIGLDKVGPKKILELMEVSWLKRENVASHLQKYRLSLSRKQKGEELKATSSGIKHSNISSKDSAKNVYFQHLINQNIMTTENCAARGLHVDNAKIWEENINTNLSMPMTLEAKNALFGDVVDPPMKSPSGISFNQSFGEVNSELMIPNQYTWSAEVPSNHFHQQPKPMFQSVHEFDQHSYGKNISYSCEKVTTVENEAAFYPGQVQSHITFNPVASSMLNNAKNHNLEQNLHDNLDSSLKNLILGTGSTEFQGASSLGEFYAQNHELGYFESFSDALPNLYDSVILGCENLSDLVIDQGHLFNDLH